MAQSVGLLGCHAWRGRCGVKIQVTAYHLERSGNGRLAAAKEDPEPLIWNHGAARMNMPALTEAKRAQPQGRAVSSSTGMMPKVASGGGSCAQARQPAKAGHSFAQGKVTSEKRLV